MMLFEVNELSSVFVKDKEFASINAIRHVFLDVRHMLCTFHISKSVEQHCKNFFKARPFGSFLFEIGVIV